MLATVTHLLTDVQGVNGFNNSVKIIYRYKNHENNLYDWIKYLALLFISHLWMHVQMNSSCKARYPQKCYKPFACVYIYVVL